ncbi:CCD17 protein, partial [Anseranas semipalmata]|nr:CCD17 protein [Anseranas semipalmata]
ALRQAYLHSGGHDAAILAQLLDLQVEATVLEKRAARRTEPSLGSWPLSPLRHPAAMPAEHPRGGTRGLDAVLLAVELENQRLEAELVALKVRRERRADTGSLAARQHVEDLAQLQVEVGMLRRQVEGMGPRVTPAILPPPVAPPLPP